MPRGHPTVANSISRGRTPAGSPSRTANLCHGTSARIRRSGGELGRSSGCACYFSKECSARRSAPARSRSGSSISSARETPAACANRSSAAGGLAFGEVTSFITDEDGAPGIIRYNRPAAVIPIPFGEKIFEPNGPGARPVTAAPAALRRARPGILRDGAGDMAITLASVSGTGRPPASPVRENKSTAY